MKGKVIVLLSALLAASGSFAADAPKPADSGKPLAAIPQYKVEGDKVDSNTLEGWKTWRALACERCHGAQQQGMVGPSLIEAFKTITPQEFHRTVFGGRQDKGMPDFSSSKKMQDNWQNLYAFLKGRSDGKIPPGDLHPLGK